MDHTYKRMVFTKGGHFTSDTVKFDDDDDRECMKKYGNTAQSGSGRLLLINGWNRQSAIASSDNNGSTSYPIYHYHLED